MLRSVVMGVGSALPARVMTNADISKIVDTSHEWIVERTGIHARHIAGDGETTRTLAVAAARKALAHANMQASEIDLVIVATSTPDNTFPATATLVQADLGITQGAAFDVQAVCSGFVYALTTADALIRAEQAKAVLACCLAMGQGRLFSKRSKAKVIMLIAAFSPPSCAPMAATTTSSM
jgi:3-oxoacyl-[acyl-carrier-protein] synthase III